jgi:hypothetical protein
MAQGEIETFGGIAVGNLGDLCVIVYVETPDLARLRWLYDHCDAILRAHPESFLGLQVILPSSNAPDGPARLETRRRLPAIDPHVRRLATVAVGDDIKAAVVRTIIRCTFMLSPLRTTRFVTDTVSRALDSLLTDASKLTPRRSEATLFIQSCFDVLRVDEDERSAAFGYPSSAVRLSVRGRPLLGYPSELEGPRRRAEP